MASSLAMAFAIELNPFSIYSGYIIFLQGTDVIFEHALMLCCKTERKAFDNPEDGSN